MKRTVLGIMVLEGVFLGAGIVTAAPRETDESGPATERPPRTRGAAKMVEPSFFGNCAFISVDFQEITRQPMESDADMPEEWRAQGFTVADCNAATDYLFDVALPNGRKVADACRAKGMPMVFVHWGWSLPKGMDLAPAIRKTFLKEYGEEYDKWPHHVSSPTSRPAEALDVRDGDYVIAKTDQDAFTSSNLGFVLANSGVKNLVFVGGHAGACLGKTARHAKELGYATLCVEDATWDARESTRKNHIRESNYDYIVSTSELVNLMAPEPAQRVE